MGEMPSAVATDDIYERYLRKAIGEINELGDELLSLADDTHVPVLGSGHPLADVFLLKHRPQHAEIAEGVAFFGRSGSALLKSLQRLGVDPLCVYGTNCLKFGTESGSAELSRAAGWLARELHIVQPRLLLVMGEEARRFVDGLEFPLSDRLAACRPGTICRFTPTIDALVTPDIDVSLDAQPAKAEFWGAFKALGPWWDALPPY